ncbi:MAG: TerC family protein [Thermoleophilaceae bacterium]|nr:TerC family protein [Thermoleophilaceae bacterium]
MLLAKTSEAATSSGASAPTWLWIGFAVSVVFFLFLDLFVFHKGAHKVDIKEALWANVLWVAIGLGFGLIVLWELGSTSASEYYAGYLLERALSVDNVFVFAVIFAYFKVPPKLQNGVLFWGLIMALFMRAGFILAGSELIEKYDWVIYFFGILLIATGIRMATHDVGETDPSKNLALRFLRKLMPVSHEFHGEKYFIKPEDVGAHEEFDAGRKPGQKGIFGVLVATPLAAAILVVAATDLVFAIDSIPAIFAITSDKFIIYTSNAFALLGMRALYFLLADAMDRFIYLQMGLAVVLVFVGVKFMISEIYHVPIGASLGFIVLAAGGSIVWSLLATRGQGPLLPGEPVEDLSMEPRRDPLDRPPGFEDDEKS